MLPDLDTLADFVGMTEAWEQGGLPVQSLLDDALPFMQRMLPHVAALRLYHAAESGELLPLASTDNQLNLRPAIQTSVPILTDDKSAWLIPLNNAMLEAVMIPSDDVRSLNGVAADIEAGLKLVGRILGNSLERQQTRQAQMVASRLVKINRAIASAESYGEMCRIMLDVLPPAVTLTSLMLFDQPAEDDALPTTLSIKAAATREAVLYPEIHNVFPENEPLIRAFVDHLNSGEPFITADARKLEKPLTANSMDYFGTLGATSFVTVGLRTAKRLLGVLIAGSPESLRLSQSQLNHFFSAADQVAETIDVRQLLQERESSLLEARTLYNMNRDLLTSESPIDLLRVLRVHLAPNAAALAFYTFTWDEATDQLTSLITEALIDRNGERELRREMLSSMSLETVAAITADRLAFGQDVVVSDDVAAAIEERPAARYLFEQRVRGSVILPIQDGGRVVQQINIHYDTPQQFNEFHRRLYSVARDQIAIILENHRLLRDTQAAASSLGNQVRVLQMINQLTAELVNTQNEQVLMDRSCEALVDALHVDHASIVLLSEDQQSAQIVSEYPILVGIGTPIELNNPLQDELRELRTVTITDINNDPRLPDYLRQELKERKIHSMLFHPLTEPRMGYIGSIGLSIHRDRYLTAEMKDITRTIATQMTVTLQNIRLLRNSQYQARQMEGIVGFGQSIQATFDLPTLLDVSLLNIAQIVPMHHISVLFYDMAHSRLKTVAMREETGANRVDINGVLLVDLAGTTAEKAWVTRDTIHIQDTSRERIRYACNVNMRSVMALPIFARGAAIGVIEVGNRQPGAFSQVDMTVFQQIVSQFAIAVENAEAYTQSQRLAQSKILVNEISSQLQEEVEVDQLLHVATRELGKALGAKQARVRLDVRNIGEAG